MKRMKQTSLHAMLDCAATKPEGSKLSPGDDRVLLCRYETDEPIHMNN